MIKILLFASLFVPIIATSQVREKNFNLDNHLAIQGYDPTAYFNTHKAVKGKKEFSYNYEGVTYYFSSAENRNLFIANPAKYEPQYGGWCATALAVGHGKVDVDPKSFKVTDGKLFLFYNGLLADARKVWVKDEPGNIVKADQAWKKIAE